jgi:type II secretory pathway pseudopilin PulG
MTLVELLVVMSLSIVIVGAALTSMTAVERQTAADTERANVIQEAEAGLMRMTRELREAYAVHARSGDAIEVRLRSRAADIDVRYSCAEPHPSRAGMFQCVRITVEGGTPRRELLVDRVLNAGAGTPADQRVFQYPNGRPSFVQARVRVPAAGDKPRVGHRHSVVLDDGFYMRNCDAGC